MGDNGVQGAASITHQPPAAEEPEDWAAPDLEDEDELGADAAPDGSWGDSGSGGYLAVDTRKLSAQISQASTTRGMRALLKDHAHQ
jgi:hypothetical protein